MLFNHLVLQEQSIPAADPTVGKAVVQQNATTEEDDVAASACDDDDEEGSSVSSLPSDGEESNAAEEPELDSVEMDVEEEIGKVLHQEIAHTLDPNVLEANDMIDQSLDFIEEVDSVTLAAAQLMGVVALLNGPAKESEAVTAVTTDTAMVSTCILIFKVTKSLFQETEEEAEPSSINKMSPEEVFCHNVERDAAELTDGSAAYKKKVVVCGERLLNEMDQHRGLMSANEIYDHLHYFKVNVRMVFDLLILFDMPKAVLERRPASPSAAIEFAKRAFAQAFTERYY